MRGPNMSYCAFENTSHAMEQLIEMLETASDEGMRDFLNDMNSREKSAFNEIYDLCVRLQEAVVSAQEQADNEDKAEFDAYEREREEG